MVLGFEVLGSRFWGWGSRFWGWASRFWDWGSRFRDCVARFWGWNLCWVSRFRCKTSNPRPIYAKTAKTQAPNHEPQPEAPQGDPGDPLGVRGFGGPWLEKRSGFEVRKPGFEDLAGGAAKVPSGRGVGGRVTPPPFKRGQTLRPMVDGFHARKNPKWAASPPILGGSGNEIKGVADHFG